jgi:type VI secretion system protein ImpF
MPRNEPDPRAQIPILDRLLDDEPRNRSSEAPPSRFQSVRIYRASVRRDLEWLLNTRCTPEVPTEAFDEVRKSVYCYGLPDFSSYTIGSTSDRATLLRFLKGAIEIFEPRLSNVTVAINPDAEKEKRVLRFVIAGLLHMDPAPEQVAYDSVLELSRNEYKVMGE